MCVQAVARTCATDFPSTIASRVTTISLSIPPLEVQAAQPAQLAGRAKIGSKRCVILKVYGVADGNSKIGELRRKMTRGMEQIDVNAHSEAASVTSV